MRSPELTFGLVHGSWHGAWCWEYLQKELETKGQRAVAMDLPIDDPRATFNEYSDVVVDALNGYENIVLVGHSRAGNVIPRAAGRLAAQKMIFLCSSFESSTVKRLTETERTTMPPRNTKEYLEGIISKEDGRTIYDPELAKKYMYNDCSKDIQEWASSQLKYQYRYIEHPELSEWPDTPYEYIVSTQDLAVLPAWQEYASHTWLNRAPIKIHSGHSPFLSQPRELAELLLNLSVS